VARGVLHKPLLFKEAAIVLLLLTGEVPRAVDLPAVPREGRVAILEMETPSLTEMAMRTTNLGSKEVVMEAAKEAVKEEVKKAVKEMAITAVAKTGVEMEVGTEGTEVEMGVGTEVGTVVQEDTGTGAAIKSNCFDQGVIGGRVQYCRLV
jgi:hypothetical protein